MAKHTVSKSRFEDGEILEGHYVYRDIEFYINESTPAGYWGRYTIMTRRIANRNFAKQSEVKAAIDAFWASKGE